MGKSETFSHCCDILIGTMTEDWVNEEGEMMMAYQSAKDTNRLLEAQLQAMTKNFKLQEKELREEITKHKHEIEKQQRIISEVSWILNCIVFLYNSTIKPPTRQLTVWILISKILLSLRGYPPPPPLALPFWPLLINK